MTELRVRPARPEDATAIARIYNQGIDDRIATFETEHRTADDVAQWLGTRFPVVVITRHDEVIAFASTSTYRPRQCYAGIAEFSVYVDRSVRGIGAGRAAMDGLIRAATDAGFWKLVSRVFSANVASRALLRSLGFREVGVYERHAQLDGTWLDVVIVERLLNNEEAGTSRK